jgi:predicted outer membrane repeat protein
MKTFRILVITLVVVVSFATTFTPSQQVSAATFTVTTPAQLIAAINNANNETLYPGQDTIYISGTLSFSTSNNTSNGPNALPVITSDVVIGGSGQTTTFITRTGTNKFRFFKVASSGKLTLRRLTLSNGNAGGSFSDISGGAVWNDGTLVIQSADFRDNRADYGGAIWSRGSVSISQAYSSFPPAFENNSNGGAIRIVSGNLNISDTFITSNSSGGISVVSDFTSNPQVTIARSSISQNTSTLGGAIYIPISGRLTVSDTTFDRNLAGSGGAIYLANEGSGIITASITYSNIQRNTSTDSLVGAAIFTKANTSNPAVTLELNNSCILGNSSQPYDIMHDGPAEYLIDATNNWWGAGGPGSGSNDNAAPQILVAPWKTSSPSNGPGLGCRRS